MCTKGNDAKLPKYFGFFHWDYEDKARLDRNHRDHIYKKEKCSVLFSFRSHDFIGRKIPNDSNRIGHDLDEFGRKIKLVDVWEKLFIILTAGYG